MGSTLLALLLSAGVNAQFAGRYTDGKDYAVYIEQTAYGLTIRPVLWTATQLLRENGKDHFVVVDRKTRTVDFTRSQSGGISGIVIHGMDGEGLELRRSEQPMLPIELLLAGRSTEAVKDYLARGDEGKRRMIEAATQVRRRLPTKTRSVINFLLEGAPHFTNVAEFHKQLGLAYVQAGDRPRARVSLRRFYRLDPADQEVISALNRLGSPPVALKDDGWKIPFPISAVFSKPTAAEIRAVEADWATRDLKPSGIREELQTTITIRGWTARVRMVSHLVLGSRHYGAIIVPQNARPGCCPVIVEAKGVSPTYFPLDLERIASPGIMGDLANRFIYVVPGFRGEVINFADRTFTSEGDRRNALDGATDDAIALLNVGLETTPEADPDRICAFGHSRGGTVALLAGIRDRRINCVVNWAGPTDWFYRMGTGGWTEQELWAEGLRNRAKTTDPGGQNIERFLQKAIDGEEDLKAVRHRMIASSPVYFTSRLPLSQHHYGLDDPFVPALNGYALRNVLHGSPKTARRFTAYFYPGEGHDTDRLAAPTHSRAFIAQALQITADRHRRDRR
jgi:hypothetical protein